MHYVHLLGFIIHLLIDFITPWLSISYVLDFNMITSFIKIMSYLNSYISYLKLHSSSPPMVFNFRLIIYQYISPDPNTPWHRCVLVMFLLWESQNSNFTYPDLLLCCLQNNVYYSFSLAYFPILLLPLEKVSPSLPSLGTLESFMFSFSSLLVVSLIYFCHLKLYTFSLLVGWIVLWVIISWRPQNVWIMPFSLLQT